MAANRDEVTMTVTHRCNNTPTRRTVTERPTGQGGTFWAYTCDCGDTVFVPRSEATACNEPVRGGGECKLDPDHTGHHSTVTFCCDGCGKRRRGTWSSAGRNRYDGMVEAVFCFLCARGKI